jgi:hypothetical protein
MNMRIKNIVIRQFLVRDQSGSVIVIVAILLTVLLGFAALAVDIGRLMVAKNELQNAADAAALAGASHLYPQIPPSSPSPPDWTTATTEATNSIGLNKSDRETLTSGTVQAGYWDYASPPPGPSYTLKGTGIPPGAQDFAAVQVTIPIAVQHWLAPIIGINTSNVSAMATAVMASPGTAFEGATMPFAISEGAATQLNFYENFEIADIDGVKKCNRNGNPTQCGQWTTLLSDGSNSNSWIKDLIKGAESSPEVSIGGSINIVPGTRTSSYKEVIDNLLGETVLLPVVRSDNPSQPDIPDSPGGYRTITGFVCFKIVSVYKHGNKSYITGHMVSPCYAAGTGGFGPNNGAYSPPRLVQ